LEDYGTDCGLFLLHYIEKFLEVESQKLIYHNLDDMFNDNWFSPIEASNLREKKFKEP
jgi:Ulp1 family protease